MSKIRVLASGSTNQERSNRSYIVDKLLKTPIEKSELVFNLGLYITRQNLSRILFMHELYSKIINVHGVIMEFGVRWGQNMALFENFRGIYEPYNYNRKIIGFDTFSGFLGSESKGGVVTKDSSIVLKGDYSVTENYNKYLEDILVHHESESPVVQKRKFQLVKGDATENLKKYLSDNPETIISLAYFDFDLYKPTKVCLELIKDRLTKGSILVFDELNCPELPGETLALKEVFGLSRYALRRSPLNPLVSYLVID
ncbi:MAG: CalS11 [Candidatus Magasanikbacteria bacterium GW2011_GWC2_45_8]|uniref:CalS11 n=1 Tax=Candidatus Magasanikbacteria bacterium GW2011_GWC2_45_8 TaxID=1619050 RepID=A0A0G1QYW5_9BACT|nr:MAG: CalS11 [Candidatus Magasanikbacteria bacterium GW2011_GWC2_45_8]